MFQWSSLHEDEAWTRVGWNEAVVEQQLCARWSIWGVVIVGKGLTESWYTGYATGYAKYTGYADYPIFIRPRRVSKLVYNKFVRKLQKLKNILNLICT